jgi:hypothetical protein
MHELEALIKSLIFFCSIIAQNAPYGKLKKEEEMKRFLMVVLLIVVTAVMMMGCASYNPRTGVPDVKTFQETGIKANTDMGMIVAYPIQTKEDADIYFDNVDIAKQGLLPIYIHVGSNQIDTVFIQAKNRSIPTISAEIAYKLIKKSHGGREVGWGIWTYGIGAPISAAHTASVNNKIEQDLKEKEFKSGSGFLYFKISDDLESLDDYFLIFVLRKNLTVKLPLKGVITAK